MAAKYSKTVQKELMQKEIEQSPEILGSKRLIIILMVVWIASRVLTTIVEIVGAVQGMWEFSATNIGGVIIMFIFAAGVYAGEKLLAVLPIMGGALMLVQCLMYGHLFVIFSNEYYMIARVYSLLFLLTSAIQVGVFAYIALSKKTGILFDAYKRSVAAARQDWELTHMK